MLNSEEIKLLTPSERAIKLGREYLKGKITKEEYYEAIDQNKAYLSFIF